MIDEVDLVKREGTEAPPHIQCSRLLLSQWCMAALTRGCVGATPLIFRGSKWGWSGRGVVEGTALHWSRNFANKKFRFFTFTSNAANLTFNGSTLTLQAFTFNAVAFSSFTLVVVVVRLPSLLVGKRSHVFWPLPFPQPQETTPCQKRRWRGGGRGLLSLHKKDGQQKS